MLFIFLAAMAIDLKEGDLAPAFSAKGDDGKTYSLKELKKTVVLYFYPKDDTAGCTAEAQAFRDDSDKYKEKDTIVLGVSLDSAESHQEFRKKYNLNFPLLVGGEDLARQYGVPVTLGFASRQTFIIGKDGRIKKIYRDVNAKTHSQDVLKQL